MLSRCYVWSQPALAQVVLPWLIFPGKFLNTVIPPFCTNRWTQPEGYSGAGGLLGWRNAECRQRLRGRATEVALQIVLWRELREGEAVGRTGRSGNRWRDKRRVEKWEGCGKTKKHYICLLSSGILKRKRGLENGADRNQINAPEKLYDSSPPSRSSTVIAW